MTPIDHLEPFEHSRCTGSLRYFSGSVNTLHLPRSPDTFAHSFRVTREGSGTSLRTGIRNRQRPSSKYASCIAQSNGHSCSGVSECVGCSFCPAENNRPFPSAVVAAFSVLSSAMRRFLCSVLASNPAHRLQRTLWIVGFHGCHGSHCNRVITTVALAYGITLKPSVLLATWRSLDSTTLQQGTKRRDQIP